MTKTLRTAEGAAAAVRLEDSGLIQHAGFLLNKAAAIIRHMFEMRLAALGIGARHYGLLLYVSECGAVSQQEIAERIGVDRTTMVAVIDDAERMGLARRQVAAGDRRKHAIVITDAGKRLLKRAAALAVAAEDEFLESLSPAERRQLKTLLKRVVLQERAFRAVLK
ncbi:MAG TPA: MarR family transcriptional regulator [Planctomycetota bacterium]|nr:MarR family transcriptional regulator [Planctomycetota bacterium]